VFFYLLLPFAVPVLRRLSRTALLALAALCVLANWGTRLVLWTVYSGQDLASWVLSDGYLLSTYSPIARRPEFLLGVALALAVGQGWAPRVPVPAAGLALGVLVALLWLWGGTGWNRPLWVEAAGHVLIPLFGLLIGAAAVRDGTGSHGFLRTRVMVRLGWWSYAFYLMHFLLFAVADLAPPT